MIQLGMNFTLHFIQFRLHSNVNLCIRLCNLLSHSAHFPVSFLPAVLQLAWLLFLSAIPAACTAVEKRGDAAVPSQYRAAAIDTQDLCSLL